MRDASLDDFFGSDESEADSDAEGDPETAPPLDPEPEPEPKPEPKPEPEPDAEESPTSAEADSLAVRPAQATYDWSPAGAECAACGESVETRWHDSEVGMVCERCKEW